MLLKIVAGFAPIKNLMLSVGASLVVGYLYFAEARCCRLLQQELPNQPILV